MAVKGKSETINNKIEQNKSLIQSQRTKTKLNTT